jgi:hypothetical protein
MESRDIIAATPTAALGAAIPASPDQTHRGLSLDSIGRFG